MVNLTQPPPDDPNGSYIPDIHPDMYIGVSALGLVLTTVVVALRVYVRAVMIKSFGRDDWALLVAYVLFAAHCCLLIWYGIIIRDDGLYARFLDAFAVFEFHHFIYNLDQIAVKVALGAFFLKVLPAGEWQAKTIKVSVGIFSVFTLILAFVTLFQCGSPLDLENPNPTCIDLDKLGQVFYFSAAFNMAMDWLMTFMPISVIWSAQMSRRTKASVIFIMCLGALASIISLIRIPLMKYSLLEGYEGFEIVTPYLMMGLWENGVGIIAISMAALRPLVRHFAGGSKVQPSTYEARQSEGHMSKQLNVNVKRAESKDGITIATAYEVDSEAARLPEDEKM